MSEIRTVTASLQRCMKLPGFTESFLELLAARCPEVGACIASHGGGPLRVAAQRCMTTVVLAVAGMVPPDEARRKFEACKATGGVGLTPDLYPAWADCLVGAVAVHDPDFTPELETAWRAVLASGGSSLMLCGETGCGDCGASTRMGGCRKEVP